MATLIRNAKAAARRFHEDETGATVLENILLLGLGCLAAIGLWKLGEMIFSPTKKAVEEAVAPKPLGG